MLSFSRYTPIAALTAAVLFVQGCEQKQEQAAPPPPASVSVSKPDTKKVSDFVEFTGTTEAVASVDVRARVKGFLKKINFVEGAYVKEGDLLYEIEPDVFQADIFEPTIAMPADDAGSLAVRDDVADNHVADGAHGR